MAKNTDKQFEAIRIVGGLLSSKVLHDARRYQLPGQSKEDYCIEPGLSFNDEIGRYWRIAQARWKEYYSQIERQDISSQVLAQDEWLIPLLSRVLGYDLAPAISKIIGEREFPITHVGHNGAVPMVLCGANYDLDKGHALFGQEGRKRSPIGLAQEYLNAESSSLWAIVSNGLYLRLLRDNPAMTRPAYIEVDFARMFEEDNYADFATFWLMFQASRLMPLQQQPEQCWLEQWREKGQDDGERALDKLRYGVADALRQLGTGFIANKNNSELREHLTNGELTTDAYYQQVLKLVYRFLFLLTAEDRDVALLPKEYEGQDYLQARKLYLQGYSISQLRDRARLNRHYDHHCDGWQQLLVTFDGFAKGQPLLAQPALGGLFASNQCTSLLTCELENRYLFSALFNLCYFEYKGTLSRINYRDMDTEEFGSVYESLLELIPQLSTEGKWQFSFMGDADDEQAASGHSRKLTGSYYTPDSLVQELIKSALEPVIEQRLKANPQQPRDALLSITVCDPACGSGHFLLAAARRLATDLARIDAGTDQPTEQHFRHALRDVMRHCIYGVDLNPMAVELCKTGLWLESIEPGKPLNFLDAHVQNGNALVGILDHSLLETGIPGDAYKPHTGDDKIICSKLKKQNATALKRTKAGDKLAISLRQIPQAFRRLEAMPEDTVEQVEAKRQAFSAANQSDDYHHECLKEDLFTAAFFASKTEDTESIIPTSAHLILLAEGEVLDQELVASVRQLARRNKFFHWPLAFPQIFGDQGKGGFDVMLGNPPWDVSQFGEEEYFSSCAPEIAAMSGAKRKRAIAGLEETSPSLWERYLLGKTAVECQNQFYRIAGRNSLTAKGKLNLYALFAEHFANAINSKGRSGVIVPTGIATDDSKKLFFENLISNRQLVSILGFDNQLRIFPSVHSDTPFGLCTFGKSDSDTELCFYLLRQEHINQRERRFSLSAADFSLINPNTKTCPVFRSKMDAELTKKLYQAAPVLIEETSEDKPEKNSWGIRFSQGLFNMTSASHLFSNYIQAKEHDESMLPLYEAKMIHHYDHRWATYETDGETSRDCTLAEKQNPDYQNLPRYWVPKNEVTLRTTKAPKLVLDATKKQLTDKLNAALNHWLAGWLLDSQKGKEDWILLGALLGVPANTNDGDMFSSGLSPLAEYAIEQHQQYPLQVEEAASLLTRHEQQSEPWQYIWALLEARRPNYLLGWRDITNATNERTVIAGVIPLSGVGNNMPLIHFNGQVDARQQACLLGCLVSMTFDFVARHKVGGTHLNFFIIKQLPTLSPDQYKQDDQDFIVPRVLELTYTAHDLKPFAEDLGYNDKPFPFNPERRHQIKCELDAYYAKLYGLTRDELRYILDPADVMGDDYPSETFRGHKNKQINEFGDYRTAKLVLREFDRMTLAEEAHEPYISPLIPPPGHQTTSTYSPQGVIRDEQEARLAGLVMLLIREAGTLSRQLLTLSLTIIQNPDNARTLLSAEEFEWLDAYRRDSDGMFESTRLDRLQLLLRFFENTGDIRFEQNGNKISAIPSSTLPSGVIIEEGMVEVAGILLRAAHASLESQSSLGMGDESESSVKKA